MISTYARSSIWQYNIENEIMAQMAMVLTMATANNKGR